MARSRLARSRVVDDVDRFDRRAPTYDRGWRAEFHSRVVTSTAQLALLVASDAHDVLDIGCGSGALLAELASVLPNAVVLAGVDPAPRMISIARARMGSERRCRLIPASAEDLPFDDATFDLVVSTVSFHHWADQAAGLREAARIMRPTARFILVDHYASGWLRAFSVLARRDMRSCREVEAMFAAAGLTPVRWVRVFDLGPMPLIRAVIARCTAA